MIIFDRNTKELDIPVGLGNLEVVVEKGGGEGSTVSYEQLLSAGTEIGRITIDGNTTDIYAPGKPTYNLDTMSIAERVDLFNLLSGQTAADVNLHYDFYTNSGRGDIETRLKVEVYGVGDGGVRFAGVVRNMIDRSRLWVFNSLLEPNGTLLNEPYNYSVAWDQIVTGGTKIATFTMNDTHTDVYAGNVSSTAVNNIWVGTTAQYNAIATKDPKTLYFINDN